jgi:voltage-gated potassium channel
VINKAKIKQILEDNNTPKGKRFDQFIIFMILVSLVDFSLDTLPNNPKILTQTLNIIEVFCVVIFTLEYILRLYVSDKTWRYIFSFFGIIDLLAILPFYIGFAIDLRSLRAFRVFRIFRAFKLVRYNQALSRFRKAAEIVKEEIILFLIITLIFTFLSAAGIYYFENEAQPEIFSSIFSSFWWAIVTLTTVGYGDVYPITVGGKIFTFFVLLIGVGIVTIPAGLVASALQKAREIEDDHK